MRVEVKCPSWRRKLREMQPAVKHEVALHANDRLKAAAVGLRMTQLTRIHADKTPIRLHYIAEWAAKRGMRQADIVRKTGVDKSTVSRWFKGTLPSEDHLIGLKELFALDEVASLFRDPDDDWLTRLFRNRSDEERQRIMKVIELSFPPRTGTDG